MSLIRKRKLTKNQTRQIQKNQETIIDDGTFATGVVVSHFGKQLDVQITALPDIMPQTALALGQIWRCHVRTNLPMLTTGDTVKFSIDDVAGTGRIEQLLPRTTLITRQTVIIRSSLLPVTWRFWRLFLPPCQSLPQG